MDIIDENGQKHTLELKTSTTDGQTWDLTFEDKTLNAPTPPATNSTTFKIKYDSANKKWNQ